ncbi:glycosyltransferase [Thiomicrorhabdus sp. 6S2-11]|uniref:Glycosyltransferase n=1 Tax=Thiomicrorhabdus marina TaxID=2818442 RepID=A0ABS3Q1X4_9GAMM|nr:glycosyltransferase [Thiomicrorhabdus marina]MBO1926325.1 glycosyltransferase [Thiomicrorhabdus marina]
MLKQNKIKYIGYYYSPELGQPKRLYSPAAATKMDYVASTLVQNDYDVEILSLCKPEKEGIVFNKKTHHHNGYTINLIASLGTGNKLRNVLDYFLGNLILFLILIFKTKKNEMVFVYHSLGYGKTITLAKQIRKFKLVLEVEEIYQDAVTCSTRQRKQEKNNIMAADAYIFPTYILNSELNTSNKPSIVIHGTYSIQKNDSESACTDGFINVVYAGTFDIKKGGVYAAIKTAQYLPEIYKIHILGFGSDEEVKSVESLIKQVNDSSSSKVFFHGLITGKDFTDFLFSCSIGLSTQEPNAKYNETSFPSKVLTYMAHGLQVVSVRIKAVEGSDIGGYIHFYDSNRLELIAETIKNIDLQKITDTRDVISDLDIKTIKKMSNFISSVTQ